jgi:hypothetical protein
MRPTFAFQDAAVNPEVPEKSATLQVEMTSRCAADGDGDGFAFGIGRNASQTILTPILEDQQNRLDKVVARLVLGRTLAIGARHFRTVRNVQVTIAFENSGEFVAHDTSGSEQAT